MKALFVILVSVYLFTYQNKPVMARGGGGGGGGHGGGGFGRGGGGGGFGHGGFGHGGGGFGFRGGFGGFGFRGGYGGWNRGFGAGYGLGYGGGGYYGSSCYNSYSYSYNPYCQQYGSYYKREISPKVECIYKETIMNCNQGVVKCEGLLNYSIPLLNKFEEFTIKQIKNETILFPRVNYEFGNDTILSVYLNGTRGFQGLMINDPNCYSKLMNLTKLNF